MRCPFKLPVKKIVKRPYANPYIEDNEGKELCMCQDEVEADYIVQAINSHEKIVEACDHAYSFMICVTNLDNEENLKWQENVTEELKQALKEAEKE